MITTVRNILIITAGIYLGISVAYKWSIIKLDAITPVNTTTKQYPASTQKHYPPPVDEKPTVASDRITTAARQPLSVNRRDSSSLPRTSLKLKLWGTATGSIDKAYAVIEKLTTKSQHPYKIGDTVETAVIKEIHRKKVVLHVNGRDEILTMEDNLQQNAAEDGDRSIAAEAPTLDLKIDRSHLDAAVESRSFLRTARIRPHFENANVTGFMITDIKSNSVLKELGLQDGDVVTDLDGKKFRLTNDIINYYRTRTSGISIGVIRNGQKKKINYSFE